MFNKCIQRRRRQQEKRVNGSGRSENRHIEAHFFLFPLEKIHFSHLTEMAILPECYAHALHILLCFALQQVKMHKCVYLFDVWWHFMYVSMHWML